MTQRLMIGLLVLAGCGSVDDGPGTEGPGGGKADGGDSDPDSNRDRTCPGGCDEGTVCDDIDQVCIAEPGSPTLRSPISGARTTGRPDVTWSSSASAADSMIKICRDISCTDVVERLFAESEASLAQPLPRGVYFVRGYGRALLPGNRYVIGAVRSATRMIVTSGADAATFQPLGLENDFDRDGRTDLLRTVGGPGTYPSELNILLANGERPRVTRSNVSSSFGSAAIPVLDTDGDGFPEIVTAAITPTKIEVLRYELDADDALVLVDTVEVDLPMDHAFKQLLSLGDVDRDGLADVGVELALPVRNEVGTYGGTLYYRTGAKLQILRGATLGLVLGATHRFDIPVDEQPNHAIGPGAGTPPLLRAVGDVDGDGFPDLAFGVDVPDAADRDVSWHRYRVDLLRGAAASAYKQSLARLPRVSRVSALGDINGDGRADVGGVQHAGYRFTNGQMKGLDPARVVLLYGGAGALTATTGWSFPVTDLPGCTNGATYYYSKFLEDGVFVGGGDLDGDGYDDALVGTTSTHEGTGTGGAYCHDTGGRVRALYGSPSGLGAAPVQTVISPAGANRYFPTEITFVGNAAPTSSGDEVVLGTDPHRDSPTESYDAGRTDVFSGPRGSLSPVRSL